MFLAILLAKKLWLMHQSWEPWKDSGGGKLRAEINGGSWERTLGILALFSMPGGHSFSSWAPCSPGLFLA
jgi:hypothetical protein